MSLCSLYPKETSLRRNILSTRQKKLSEGILTKTSGLLKKEIFEPKGLEVYLFHFPEPIYYVTTLLIFH